MSTFAYQFVPEWSCRLWNIPMVTKSFVGYAYILSLLVALLYFASSRVVSNHAKTKLEIQILLCIWLFYHSASLFLSLVAVKSMTCEIHDLSKTSPGHVFHKSCISQVMDFTRKHMYFTSHEVMYFTKFSPFHPLVFPDLRFPRPEEVQETRRISSQNEGHQGWRPWLS